MSLILDALRKAERERASGKPGSIDALTQPFPPLTVKPQRPVWPWLAAATVALAALALTLVLLRKPPAPAEVAAAPPVAPVAVPAEEPALIPADEALQMPAPEPEPEPQQMSELEEELQDPSVIAPGAQPPLDPVDVEQEAPSPDEETANVEPARPGPEVETLTLDPAPLPPVRKFKDLTPQYRADFPRSSVDVHVWDEDPKQRWVMVNGKRYRENDTTVEGVNVAQITREGIVFEYRGEKFLYPVY